MNEDKKTQVNTHNVILENRKKLSVSVVDDVDSFDEGQVMLLTQMGQLNVRGRDLHINKLNVDSGELVIEGDIMAFFYTDESGKKGGVLSKLFK